MKQTLMLALLALQCAFAAEIRKLDGKRITADEADAFARQTLEMHKVTGAQLAIVDGGKLVWSGSYGHRRRNPDLPMDKETTLWAASITKGVFGAFAVQMAERGEIDLDAPVAKLLSKALTDYERYREIGQVLLQDARWARVTPRILLAHSSGLRNFAFVEPDNRLRLHFDPGTQYSYSGEGLNIVQLIVEEKTGRKLEDLMQERLFTPLGMTRTGMIYRKEFAENVADRFGVQEQFLQQTKRFPARAAGSMTTSAEDLARFLIALMDGKVVSKRGLEELFKPVVQIRTLHQFAVAANEPPGEEARRVGLAYGLGWGLLTKTPYGPAFFKEGHGDGAQNYVLCFPRKKSCMILLTNSDNGELAFRPLMEKLWANTVTPWEWEGYTPSYIKQARKNGN